MLGMELGQDPATTYLQRLDKRVRAAVDHCLVRQRLCIRNVLERRGGGGARLDEALCTRRRVEQREARTSGAARGRADGAHTSSARSRGAEAIARCGATRWSTWRVYRAAGPSVSNRPVPRNYRQAWLQSFFGGKVQRQQHENCRPRERGQVLERATPHTGHSV